VVANINHFFPFQLTSPLPGDQTINQQKTTTENQQIQTIKNNPSQKVVNQQTDTPSTPSTDPSSGKQSVYVLMTYASIQNDIVSASGFVSNISESNGTCTYIFKKGTAEIDKTSSSLQNPTSTTCSTISFPSAELSSGTWTVKLIYSSSTSYGESNTRNITKL
jgi:hypothetical protein